jgi:hypothetical protein
MMEDVGDVNEVLDEALKDVEMVLSPGTIKLF